MRKSHSKLFVPAALALFVLVPFALPSLSPAMLTANANHNHIKVDFFYHGSSVSVRGVSDPGADIIVKITSPEGHQALRQKGKVGGFLWMNVGTLKFEKTPDLYYIHSTKPLKDILGEDEMKKYALGYPALAEHIELVPAEDPEEKASQTEKANQGEKARWFGEFVKFKESSKLYNISEGDIKKTPKGESEEYYVQGAWPYQAKAGEYTATVYAVKDGRVVETAEANVLVEQVGGVKALAGMAKNNGALYGALSIAIALAAGFGVGIVFGKGGGAH